MLRSNCCITAPTPSRTARLVLNTLLALVFLAGVASADTIIPTAIDPDRAMSISIWENGTVVNGAWAGVILITLSSNGQQFYRDTVCVDLFTDINAGQTYNTVVYRPDEISGKNLLRVSWLVDNAVPPVPLPNSPITEVTNRYQGAGLQLAIWDIVHDGGDGFSAGSVRFASTTDATVQYWANYYMNASEEKESDLAFVYRNFILGTNTEAQMLIGPGFYNDGGPEPAPEPPTLVLGLGALLLGIGKFFRTRTLG